LKKSLFGFRFVLKDALGTTMVLYLLAANPFVGLDYFYAPGIAGNETVFLLLFINNLRK